MKQRLILIGLLATLLVVLGCERPEQSETPCSTPAYYDPLFQRDETCDFRGIRWGMSPEEVKAAENMEVFEEKPYITPGEYLICYQNVLFDNMGSITLRYFFLDNRCFLGMYYFSENSLDIFIPLLEKLTQVYGPPTYAKDADRLVKGWQTDETFIFLSFDHDGEEPLTTVTFGSKAHRPEEWDWTYKP